METEPECPHENVWVVYETQTIVLVDPDTGKRQAMTSVNIEAKYLKMVYCQDCGQDVESLRLLQAEGLKEESWTVTSDIPESEVPA